VPAEVLLVEDNEQNMELASFLLAEAGLAVRQATNAAEARAALQRSRPRVVLLDMNLAGCDGLDLVAEWRSDARLAGLRILALTAHAMRGDRERFLAAGCDGYIAKPIDVKTFAAEVRGYCEAQPA
jgi:two-component system cell cycle response regulator DivK